MTASASPYQQMFRLQSQMIEQLTADFDEAAWAHRLGQGAPAHWQLGHIALTRRQLLRGLGRDVAVEPWEARFERGSRPGAALDPPPAELLAALGEAGEQLDGALAALTPAALAADSGREFPHGEHSVAGMLAFLVGHEMYHVGQLAMICRSLGRPGIA
jgi:uncharacterized damage-inducible protein DinB